ncbi:MAG: MFS transporter [Promethearchaeota archaeon]|nr:MAG: MFS transporter [Candidatus Lokiarchaeota archaeon]
MSKRSTILILSSILASNTSGMALYTYLPRYLEYIGTNISLIPLIISIFALTSVLFPPIMGKVSDKIQNRFIFGLIGAVGLLISFLLLLFIKVLWIINLILFFYGFSTASGGLIFVLYAEIVENDKRFISLYNAMIALGWFIGAFLCGIYVDLYGISNIFYFFLTFSILNLIFVLFIKEDRTLILKHSDIASNISDEKDIINLTNEPVPISKSIYPALFFRNFGVRPVLSIIAIFMALHLSTDAEIGFLVGINPLIQFFLILIVGEFLIKDDNIKPLMVIGYLLSAISILGYILSTDFLGFLFYQIIISLSYSLFWTTTQVYITKNTNPANKGRYVGYSNASFFLGSFAGAFFYSNLINYFSNYYMAMYFMIIFPAMASLTILLGFNKKEKNEGLSRSSKTDINAG